MKLVVGGHTFEYVGRSGHHGGCWYKTSPTGDRMYHIVGPESKALDRIAELEPLAKFGLAVAKAWRDVHDYADIDGDTIQEAAEDAGLMVEVPAGTHNKCVACEDGAMPCRGLRLP